MVSPMSKPATIRAGFGDPAGVSAIGGRAGAAPLAAPARARSRRAWARVALCLMLLGVAAADPVPGARAQEPATGQDVSAPAAVIEVDRLQELVTTLEDTAARERFLAQLKALIASSEAAAAATPKDLESLGLSFVAQLGSRMNGFAASMAELALAMVNLPHLWQWLLGQANDSDSRTYWYEVVGKITAVLLLGALGYRLVRKRTVAARDRVGQPPVANALVRLRRLAARTTLDMLPAAAFAAVSFGLLLLLGLGPAAEPVALALILATIGVQGVLLLARALLTPRMPSLRFLPIGDETAAYLYVWVKRFSYIVLYSYFVLQADVLRIPREILQGVTHLIGLVVLLMLVIFVLQNRDTVASWLRGGATGEPGRVQGTFVAVRRFLAGTWHLLAIAYLAGTYIAWALRMPGGFELMFRGAAITTVLLAFGGQLAQAVERLLGRGFAVGDDLEQRYPALQARVNRYLTILHRFSVGIVYVLIALVIMQIWGIDLIGWVGLTLGTDFGAQFVHVALLLAMMLVIWELSSAAIDHYLEALDETGARIERSRRARTLLPLLRTALVVIIALILLLHTMSVMGLDLAPLLATAGVIGIAIGFGSQKLVQDVINGMFILFQDTISVGDFVEVGGHGGTVERMSVRTMELRDLSGVVHTIPFSEITTVKNWAKEFGYAVLEVGVAYREDLDEVMEVMRQIGAELEADPEVGQFMLEPIDVWGVDAFADSAVIIKARIKTRPLKQHYVRRQFNRLLKRRFDELGIEIPFPHQTVYFGYDKAGRAAPVHVHLGGAGDGARGPAPAPAEHGGLRVIEAREASARDSATS
jgi:small conductance mechanosensitive channel